VRVPIGPVADVPDDGCIAVAHGRAVVVRIGAELRAYRNRCLHQDSPLDGGWVRDGVLSCPLHFWRYDVSTGALRSGDGCLERFAVEYEGGVAHVVLPDEAPARSLREELLARARTYDRDAAFRARDQD
jgi:nitrite reductase/ring-hydroxylating ferredoxin subunit